MEAAEQVLPQVNALLNTTAAVLLIVGRWLIRRRREVAHRRVMLTCFGVSVLFLASYLFFHIAVKHGAPTRFPEYPPAVMRCVYLIVLVTHTVLAAAVPFLAVATIYFGLRDRRAKHRRLARWTYPIWLYVSITGVVVYLMLYQLYPPQETGSIMDAVRSKISW